MLEEILENAKYVSENSKEVSIDYNVVDGFAKNFKKSSFWLMSNPFGILDLNYEEIINLLLVIHTIGDFCFWGNPKWEIDTELGVLDGSSAILYLIIKRYKKVGNFNMNFSEFQDFLKGNINIPFLKERYDMLKSMNEVIKDKSFYSQIKDIYDDRKLFTFILSHFSYFEDVREYKGKKIKFYKRAQLIVSDILHVRKLIEKVPVDYSHLIGCADYKIPQVMNSLGMLKYSQELSNKLDNMDEIPEGSIEEVEIRANTLVVIDYIYQNTDNTTRMEINDFIWLLGQDKSKITKNYHRTRTINY